MAKKWIEQRKRGFFGYVFLGIFWIWNIFMIWAIMKGAGDVATQTNYQNLPTDQQQAVAAGAGLAIGFELMIWAAGAVVFGLLAYFTRGKREMIEVEV